MPDGAVPADLGAEGATWASVDEDLPGYTGRHTAGRPPRPRGPSSVGPAVALALGAVGVGAAVVLLGPAGGSAGGFDLPPPTSIGPSSSVEVGEEPASSGARVRSPAGPRSPGGGPGGDAPTVGADDSLTVHVVGAVAVPGVVRVEAPARAVEAVEAAGGLLPEADLLRVNLARELADGEQVVVPRQGEPLPPSDVGAPATGGEPVDLNTADVAALQVLPGIGPVLAERIVRWRTEVGPFASVDELTAVSGIGDTLLDGLRDQATV